MLHNTAPMGGAISFRNPFSVFSSIGGTIFSNPWSVDVPKVVVTSASLHEKLSTVDEEASCYDDEEDIQAPEDARICFARISYDRSPSSSPSPPRKTPSRQPSSPSTSHRYSLHKALPPANKDLPPPPSAVAQLREKFESHQPRASLPGTFAFGSPASFGSQLSTPLIDHWSDEDDDDDDENDDDEEREGDSQDSAGEQFTGGGFMSPLMSNIPLAPPLPLQPHPQAQAQVASTSTSVAMDRGVVSEGAQSTLWDAQIEHALTDALAGLHLDQLEASIKPLISFIKRTNNQGKNRRRQGRGVDEFAPMPDEEGNILPVGISQEIRTMEDIKALSATQALLWLKFLDEPIPHLRQDPLEDLRSLRKGVEFGFLGE